MKKILAGVLAAASMLTVSATAFAASNDKTVTKPGEVEYDVAVTAPTVVLNLVMPTKMSAALNPYGAEITVVPATKDAEGNAVAAKTNKIGIVSTAYKVENKSEDYGVYLDATAITTITTTDKPNADKTPAWGVVPEAITAKSGVKNANLALMANDSADALAGLTKPAAASSEAKSSAQGALVMDSTVKADSTKGVVAGQTTQKKFAFVKAQTPKTDTEAAKPGEVYLGFVGVLGSSSTDKEVEWNEDDAITVTLVLKVTAGPKTLA